MFCYLYDTPTFKTRAYHLVSNVRIVRIMHSAATIATNTVLPWSFLAVAGTEFYYLGHT